MRIGWSSFVVVRSAHIFAIPYFRQLTMLFEGNIALSARAFDCLPMKKMRDGYCLAGRGREFAMLQSRLLYCNTNPFSSRCTRSHCWCVQDAMISNNSLRGHGRPLFKARSRNTLAIDIGQLQGPKVAGRWRQGKANEPESLLNVHGTPAIKRCLDAEIILMRRPWYNN